MEKRASKREPQRDQTKLGRYSCIHSVKTPQCTSTVLGTAQCSEKSHVSQVYAESLAPSIHWQVFKSMSTGFLLCFARGLHDITVHNSVSGMYPSFSPPSPCPCSTIQLKLTFVPTLGVLALPDNHPTQNTQFQKRTKFH